ncbi:MAG: hypothetical protein HLUCCA11_23905 [Phormidesmis priestleyi Ana]|uniref:Uncharacterized protein n=1 Tax=Phormidesmis priestleyi Ana TaxID=1666911 RepID=A0A0P7Z934_9CYAN|nr:MAG: hypothetical protein HLUCCA11_23905 [Phormidesmis priestleyi Ana]
MVSRRTTLVVIALLSPALVSSDREFMSRVQAAQLLLSPSVQAIGHCGARAGRRWGLGAVVKG